MVLTRGLKKTKAMFNISNDEMRALAALQSQFGGSKVSSFTAPTDCTSCWGGTCANGFTG